MPAVVRYTWMFRTVAVMFLFFGGVWLWRFGFTDFRPSLRPYGLVAGALALTIGLLLFRRNRAAIGASAVGAVVVGISAAVFAPSAKGPAILFLAAMAIVCALYAVFAARVLFEQPTEPGGKR
jgi:uncharacterized membrane protein YjjB (DUF3815 family)